MNQSPTTIHAPRGRVVGVIPARFGSTRFPGKVLADLGGKPMVQHVYERARASKLLSDLIVACDDQKVFEVVRSFGGKACMTSPHHPSGTDRVAEAVTSLDCYGVVNIQADEPLLTGLAVDQVIQGLLESKAPMSTIASPMKTLEGFSDPNVVKVVCDEEGYALYFSRAPIPHLRDVNEDGKSFSNVRWLKHAGLYGYRKDFLLRLAKSKPSRLEMMERLEQLRVLEMGERIKVMVAQIDSIGVDTPRDLEEVKKYL
jgi:3-deoxy-manno-octulosonate cytidylyltransferase (CMP-KDO synthetase)